MSRTLCFFLLLMSLLAACSDELPTSPADEQRPAAAPAFVWSRAEDASSKHAFLRHFGVGYSYDAVRGSYCEWNDLRCQIINRSELARLATAENKLLFTTASVQNAFSHSKFCYNQRDYVAAIRLDSETAIDLGLYNYEKRKRQNVLEDGLQEQFYYMLDDCVQMGTQRVAAADIIALVERGHAELLTRSFRDAIQHLADMECHTFSVDSFLNVYGTHVVVGSSVGGNLRIDLRNDLFRYQDKASEKEWTTEQLFWAYEHKEETRQSENFNWLESSSLNISARGGDQSVLASLLGPADFEGKREFSIEPVKQWRASLRYDPDDEEGSNVEMTEMNLRPIWDFIAAIDEDVADHVKAAVMQDISSQQLLLGCRNFFNTSFPVSYAEAACQYQTSAGWKTFALPIAAADIPGVSVNILSGGRYVASVCHEQIDGDWYWVAYPIYDGHIKQTDGLAVRDGRAWEIFRHGETLRMSELPAESVPQTERFYVIDGKIMLMSGERVELAESKPLLYAELNRGVRPDGSVDGTPCLVRKTGSTYVLGSEVPADAAIAGWEYDAAAHVWQRRAEYTYIYNPTEMREVP